MRAFQPPIFFHRQELLRIPYINSVYYAHYGYIIENKKWHHSFIIVYACIK